MTIKINVGDIAVYKEQDICWVIDSGEEETRAMFYDGLRDVPTNELRNANRDERNLFWSFGPSPKMFVDTMSEEDLERLDKNVQRALRSMI